MEGSHPSLRRLGPDALGGKLKDGRGRTVKHALPLSDSAGTDLRPQLQSFLADILGRSYGIAGPADLRTTLTVTYLRSTLTELGQENRVTFDSDLQMGSDRGHARLRPGLVLVETKSLSGRSAADQALRLAGVRPCSVSKYCAGIALLDPTLPKEPWRSCCAATSTRPRPPLWPFVRSWRHEDGRSVKALIGAAVAALVASSVAVPLLGVGSGNPIESHPQPELFPPSVVQPLAAQLAEQKPAADRAYARWARTHPRADDASFIAFAVAQTPAPPTGSQRAQELSEVQALATTRTSGYVATSTWLELYGKTEIWKVYRHQYADLQPEQSGQAAKVELAHTRALTRQVTAAAQARFALDAPFIADATLRPDKTIEPGTHKLSYPSKHAVEAFSALTLLGALEPSRAPEFTEMADQVAYSRLYMAGHYRSDLLAGAYLGYLIGDHEVATRM